MLRIYLTNLGKYNEGQLVGEWVELPVTEEELEKVLERIDISEEPDENGNYYEEYFITDYESDFNYKVGEYDSIEELNEVAETFDGLDDTEKEVFKVMIEEGYSSEEALEKVNDGDYMIYYNCSDMEDVAMEYVEETGLLHDIPDTLKNYFDYKSYGRDMNIEGTFIFTDNGNCIEIY